MRPWWCCWTMATRSRRRPDKALVLAALTLAACSPGAPEGVDKAVLDDAVSRAIGDPNTCLMIAEADGGDVVYRYNTATACAREWPSCEGTAVRKVKDLVELTAKDRQVRNASCDSLDPARSVAWSAGPIPGKPLVYAAVMEGDRTFPGLIMQDRIAAAFKKAGL
jgi:hypothetical protein